MMLGYLLAREGIEVQILEKHTGFLRDFRGNTVHPSTLDLRKPHLKSITDFSDCFFQAFMIEFPALLRNSQQKGERNGEYFNHRSRGLLNDSRGV
jgi:hypothetical protein